MKKKRLLVTQRLQLFQLLAKKKARCSKQQHVYVAHSTEHGNSM